MKRQVIGIFILGLVLCGMPVSADSPDWGLLLLAHGMKMHHAQTGETVNVWNRNVERMAGKLDRRIPTEVAFGMADPETIQEALDRLEARGLQNIAVIPVFVSSHSPIIGNFRYILGLQPHMAATTQLDRLDRVNTEANLVFGSAMDNHPLISDILLERARSASGSAQRTTVVLIAHGPNSEEENRLWLDDLAVHAEYLQDHGGFRRVEYLSHRNDAPEEVKARARTQLRDAVAEGAASGEVVVVPVLLSSGGIEAEIHADLTGLEFQFTEPLLPHDNVQRWVESQFSELTTGDVKR